MAINVKTICVCVAESQADQLNFLLLSNSFLELLNYALWRSSTCHRAMNSWVDTVL